MSVNTDKSVGALDALPNQNNRESTFNPKKLLFLIPIILGLGLLFASGLGAGGLFSPSPPPVQWLTPMVDAIRNAWSDTGLWVMFIVGGVLGLTAGGAGIYGLARKNIYNGITDSGTTNSELDSKILANLPMKCYTRRLAGPGYIRFYIKDEFGKTSVKIIDPTNLDDEIEIIDKEFQGGGDNLKTRPYALWDFNCIVHQLGRSN